MIEVTTGGTCELNTWDFSNMKRCHLQYARITIDTVYITRFEYGEALRLPQLNFKTSRTHTLERIKGYL